MVGLQGVAQDDAAVIKSAVQTTLDTTRYHIFNLESISLSIRRLVEARSRTRWNVLVGTSVALTAYHARHVTLRDRLTGLSVIVWN